MTLPDETTTALLASIRQVSGCPTASWAVPPEPIQGGYFAEVFKVRLTGLPSLEGDLVARVMPQAYGAVREIALQTVISQAGYPTPRIWLSSAPTPQFDRAWCLMDFAPGTLPLTGLSAKAMALSGAATLSRLPKTMARLSAQLHAIDPKPFADLMGRTDNVGEYLDSLRSRTEALGRDDLMRIGDRLRDSCPQEEPVLCHGDLHPFNVLSGPEGDVVLDWTNGRIADRHFDLAFSWMIFRYLPISAPRLVRPVITAVGWGLARSFLRHYERYTDRSIDHARLRWHTSLQALRSLVDAEERRRGGDAGGDSHPFEAMTDQLLRLAQGG